MLTLLMVAFPAFADCPYSIDTLVEDLSRTEAGLRSGDAGEAGAAATAMQEGLGCLDTTLSVALTARLYRSLGAGLVAGGDAARGEQWLSTAVELDPAYVFGVGELSADHPAISVFEQAKSGVIPDPASLSERVLGEGLWRLDGRVLNAPAATVDRPHVLQRTLDGAVQTWIVDGNLFPPETLAEPVEVENSVSRGPKARSRACRGALRLKSFIDESGSYCPATPPEQVILVLSGPIVLGAAGGLYAESFRQKRLAVDAPDVPTLDRHRRLNNRIFVASLGTAAVGLGLGVFGVTYTGTF